MIQRGCGHAEASGPTVLGFRGDIPETPGTPRHIRGPHKGIPGHRSKDLIGAA